MALHWVIFFAHIFKTPSHTLQYDHSRSRWLSIGIFNHAGIRAASPALLEDPRPIRRVTAHVQLI